MSSGVEEQDTERRHTPVQCIDQLLHSFSVLYRPESIRAWVVAMTIFEGDEPGVDHIGCGFDKDMKEGLKNSNYVSGEASDRRVRSQ